MPILPSSASVTRSYPHIIISTNERNERGKKTNGLLHRKSGRINPIVLLRELERRDDKGRSTFPQPRHDRGRAQHPGPKVGADPKVDVEHHDIVGPGKELGDVAPHVELAVKVVDDEVDVDVGGHEGRGGVERFEGFEQLLPAFVVGHVDRHRYRTC